jgi:hypothetical protein
MLHIENLDDVANPGAPGNAGIPGPQALSEGESDDLCS